MKIRKGLIGAGALMAGLLSGPAPEGEGFAGHRAQQGYKNWGRLLAKSESGCDVPDPLGSI